MLSDLRESGALEQDADVVLLLYRPNAYEDIRKKHEHADSYVECAIAKHRNGPTGPVKLTFVREHTRFTDYEATATPGPEQQALV
jgi:replicative DNA helicase